MARGRPTNFLRRAALDAGESTYLDTANPCWCGCEIRYAKNAQCTECTIAKAKKGYAALTGEALANRKAKDRARYVARKGARPFPF